MKYVVGNRFTYSDSEEINTTLKIDSANPPHCYRLAPYSGKNGGWRLNKWFIRTHHNYTKLYRIFEI